MYLKTKFLKMWGKQFCVTFCYWQRFTSTNLRVCYIIIENTHKNVYIEILEIADSSKYLLCTKCLLLDGLLKHRKWGAFCKHRAEISDYQLVCIHFEKIIVKTNIFIINLCQGLLDHLVNKLLEKLLFENCICF